MVIRKYTSDLQFENMEITDEGSIHTDSFRVEYLENKWYIRVLKVYINNNADQVPYWARLRIFPKEFEFINNVLIKANEMKKVQIGIRRNPSGILGITIYDE